MLLSELSKPFLCTFYFLAQNPFPSTKFFQQNKLTRLLSKLPVFILICVSLYVTIYSFTNDQYVSRKNHAREIIHVLLIISSSIANLAIAYQCLFLSQTWTQLQESLCRLETEFQELLPNRNVQFTNFRKHFIIKCAVMLVFYIISILSMIMSRITDEKFVTSYMVVLALLNDLSAFQVIFHVDLSKYFLKSITHAFRDVDRDHSCEKSGEAKLIKSMKKFHLSVWKTVDKINEYFGLFLLGYIVQQFLMISYDIYWIFLNKFNVGIWLGLDNAFVLISDMLSFFFLSNSCEKIFCEAEKIRIFLYERDDCLSLSESQQFLSQILNQPIKIGAKGFYKLDRSFFAALTVGSMTSAIMLVQFQFQTLN